MKGVMRVKDRACIGDFMVDLDRVSDGDSGSFMFFYNRAYCLRGNCFISVIFVRLWMSRMCWFSFGKFARCLIVYFSFVRF